MVTGDVRALALIHATRVLVIITLAPIIMTFFMNLNPAGFSKSDLSSSWEEVKSSAYDLVVSIKSAKRIDRIFKEASQN